MRRAAVKPPQCVMSSWQISQPRWANSWRKYVSSVIRSPVATGVVSAWLIIANPSMLSGQQGSSKKYSPYGSSAWPNFSPIAGDGRAWQSTMMSIPSPTASRMDWTAASASRIGRKPSIGIVGGTAIALKAVNPSSTA